MVMEPTPTTTSELCEEALEILNDPWGSAAELLPEHLQALSSELYRLRRENEALRKEEPDVRPR